MNVTQNRKYAPLLMISLFFIFQSEILHADWVSPPFKSNFRVIAIEKHITSKDFGKMCNEAEQDFFIMSRTSFYNEYAKEFEELSNKLSEAEIEAGQKEFESGNYKAIKSCRGSIANTNRDGDKNKALSFFDGKLNEIKVKQEEAKKQAIDEWNRISKIQANSFADYRQALGGFVSKYKNSAGIVPLVDISKIESEIKSIDYVEGEMNREWEHARSQNTINAYQYFLDKFAKERFNSLNPHATEAQKAIDEVKVKIENEKKFAWDSAKQKNSIDEFDKFIRAYPDSNEASEAKRVVAKLSEERQKKDRDKIANEKTSKAKQVGTNLLEQSKDKPKDKPMDTAKKDYSVQIDSAKRALEGAKHGGRANLNEFIIAYSPGGWRYDSHVPLKEVINEAENLIAAMADEEFKKAKTRYELEHFIRDYPKSNKVGKANELIATLEKEESDKVRKEEEASQKKLTMWETVKKQNSIEALDKYIKDNEEDEYGRNRNPYLGEAKQERATLVINKVKKSQCNNELIWLVEYIRANPFTLKGKCVYFGSIEVLQFLNAKSGLSALAGAQHIGFIEFDASPKSKYMGGILKIIGMYTYTSQVGQKTVPHFKMVKIVNER